MQGSNYPNPNLPTGTVTPSTTTGGPLYGLQPTTPASFAPPILERVEKPVVVHEKILPTQRTEVQPIVHRDREQVEVHKVVQPMRERDIAPTQVRHMDLPAENFQSRASDTEFQTQYRDLSSRIVPECVTAPMMTEQVQRTPIVEETVHKKIIEEVQPVLYRETIKPVVIEATKPIYEHVYESPRLMEEMRPMVDLGTRMLGTEQGFEQPMSRGFAPPTGATPTTYIHEKVTVLTAEKLAGPNLSKVQHLPGQSTEKLLPQENLSKPTTNIGTESKTVI